MKSLKRLDLLKIILFIITPVSMVQVNNEYNDKNGNSLKVSGDNSINSKVHLVTNIQDKMRRKLSEPGPTTVIDSDSSYISQKPFLENIKNKEQKPQNRKLLNIPKMSNLINSKNIEKLTNNSGGFLTSALNPFSQKQQQKQNLSNFLSIKPKMIFDGEKKRKPKKNRKLSGKKRKNRFLFDRGQISYPYANQIPSKSLLVPGEQFVLKKTQEPVSQALMDRIRVGKANSVLNFYEKTEERVVKARDRLDDYQHTIGNDNQIEKTIGKIRAALGRIGELKDSYCNKLQSKIDNFKDMKKIFNDF